MREGRRGGEREGRIEGEAQLLIKVGVIRRRSRRNGRGGQKRADLQRKERGS